MPTYHIRDTETDDIYEEFCSYDELEKFLKENPRYKNMPCFLRERKITIILIGKYDSILTKYFYR